MKYPDTDNNFVLEAQDILEQTKQKLVSSVQAGDIRSFNLMMLQNDYYDKLERALEAETYREPGIPITITTDTYQLDRIRLMNMVYPRSFFTERSQGGTELVFTSQLRGGEGYQWYVMAWKIHNEKVHLWCSHWMIDRDTKTKRNTIWFTRGFEFKEPDLSDIDVTKIDNINKSWILMRQTPDRHRRTAYSKAAPHALRNEKDTDGWVTVMAPKGAFETIYHLNSMLRKFDTSEHQAWYLNQHFKNHWSLRVLEAVWGKHMASYMMDKDGILKDLWYMPCSTDFDAAKRIGNERWKAVRDKYIEWKELFRVPPRLQAPPPDEEHLLELSDERKQQLAEEAAKHAAHLQKKAEQDAQNEEAIRKANEKFDNMDT